jgi:hypothetical protein
VWFQGRLFIRGRRLVMWEISERVCLAVSTVGAILQRLGMGCLIFLDPRPVARRYERQRAGELRHIDARKLGRIAHPGHRVRRDRTTRVRGVGREYAHVCVDDASRVAYVEIHPDETKESVVPFLKHARDVVPRTRSPRPGRDDRQLLGVPLQPPPGGLRPLLPQLLGPQQGPGPVDLPVQSPSAPPRHRTTTPMARLEATGEQRAWKPQLGPGIRSGHKSRGLVSGTTPV